MATRDSARPSGVSRLGAITRRRVGLAAGAAPRPAPEKRHRTGALGKIVALPKNAGEVLSSLLGKAKTEIRKPRPGTNVRVSDLISRCVRKKAIVERDEVVLPVSRLSLMDALTYRQGEAIHDVIKERSVLAGPSVVWGKWKCRCGSLKFSEPCLRSEVDENTLCGNCGEPATTYEEAEFVDPELKIEGHPDLILWFPDLQAFYVNELKSISAKMYEDLARPMPDHVIQALFYWFLMRRNGYPVVSSLSILYVTKGHVFRGLPYKEFIIDAQKELRRLDTYLDDARSLLRFRKDGELPPRTQCASKDCPEARACEVRDKCFSDGKEPKPVRVSFAQAAGARRR